MQAYHKTHGTYRHKSVWLGDPEKWTRMGSKTLKLILKAY